MLSEQAFRAHIQSVELTVRLDTACRSGSCEEVKRILNFGAPVNGTANGTTALVTACQHGPINLVKLLLARGADPNIIPFEGLPPLTVVCGNNSEDTAELCQLLIDYGASLDYDVSRWQNPLWLAARAGNHPVARLLLDRGVEVHPMELLLNSNSPLWIACKMLQLDVAHLLISRGADIHESDNLSPLRMVKSMAPRVHDPTSRYGHMLALFDPIPPSPHMRLRTHWRRRILFNVVGRRAANLGSKRHELGLYRISDIAAFLMAPRLPVSS